MFTLPIIFSLIYYSSFIVYVIFGIYILFLNTKTLMNRVFFALSLAMCLWVFSISIGNSSPDYETALFWRRVAALGWGSAYSVFLHFMLILTEKRRVLQNRWIYLLLYLPAALNVFIYSLYKDLLVGQYNLVNTSFGWVNVSANSLWDWYLNIYCAGFAIAGLVLIWQWGKNTGDRGKKRQAHLLVASFAIALLLGTFTDIVANTYLSVTLPQLAPVIALIPVSAIFYASGGMG